MSHRPHMSRPYMSHHVTKPVQFFGSDSDLYQCMIITKQIDYVISYRVRHKKYCCLIKHDKQKKDKFSIPRYNWIDNELT